MTEEKNQPAREAERDAFGPDDEKINKGISEAKGDEEVLAGEDFGPLSDSAWPSAYPADIDRWHLEREKPPWKIWQFFVIIAILFFLQFALSLIFPAGREIEYVIVGIICQLFLFAGAPLFLCRYYKQSYRMLGLKKSESDFTVITGIKWGVGLYVIGIIVTIIITQIFPMKQEIPELVEMLLENGSMPFKIFIALSLMVFAPVGEELLFRGFLFTALRNKINVKWAIVISGAIFGVMHFSVQGFPALFIGGMGFAFLYNKYGNIFINMVAHAAWNSVVVLLAFFVL